MEPARSVPSLRKGATRASPSSGRPHHVGTIKTTGVPSGPAANLAAQASPRGSRLEETKALLPNFQENIANALQTDAAWWATHHVELTAVDVAWRAPPAEWMRSAAHSRAKWRSTTLLGRRRMRRS
jgi:hypothetical protein